eukprot:5165714-Amphidinium_carterae.1
MKNMNFVLLEPNGGRARTADSHSCRRTLHKLAICDSLSCLLAPLNNPQQRARSIKLVLTC